MNRLPSRPLLSLPFTILTADNRVRLVAGEDFRYTLEAPGIEAWLPNWLPLLDGRTTLDAALLQLPTEHRDAARQVVARLFGERVLVNGSADRAHPAKPIYPVLEGQGLLRQLLDAGASPEAGESVPILCQDRLDYDEALRFSRRCLSGQTPFLWITCGPLSRGYVSPAFLPDAGPCLECLLRGFRRLSPVPELYDEIICHARDGGAIAPSPIPAGAAGLLQHILQAKLAWLAEAQPPAVLYRLHVVEAATLEVTTHRVFSDPNCPSCREKR